MARSFRLYTTAQFEEVKALVDLIAERSDLPPAERDRLAALGYTNATVRFADGMAGAPDLAPFDRIMVTAAADEVPAALVAQLRDGGKMILPLGPRREAQYIVKLTKEFDGRLTREELIAVRFVPLLPGQAREL